MAKVIGVGGVFLRARNVEELCAWYERVLGLELTIGTGAIFDRSQGSEHLVVSFFEPSSTYIGDPERQGAMVNYVVDDLDGLLHHLDECGVEYEPIQVEPYGRFSWTTDPEGNRLELWEPSPADDA